MSTTDVRAALEDVPKDAEPVEEPAEKEEAVEGEGKVEEGEGEVKEEGEVEGEPAKPTSSLITRAKTEFNGIFRKFPELQDSYFEAREFKQVFASPAEAREAEERNSAFESLANELVERGNVEPLLETIYATDPEALKTFAENFFPTLSTRAPELAAHVIGPVFNNMLARVYREAKTRGDENLEAAVLLLKREVFGNVEAPRPVRNETKLREPQQDQQLTERRGEFFSSVNMVVEPVVRAEIMKGLDPNKALPEALVETAVDKIMEMIYNSLRSNDEHGRMLGAIEKAARASGYSRDGRNKMAREIIRAAKELIPNARGQIKKQLFGNMFMKSAEESSQIPAGNSGSSSPINAEKIDWNKTNLRDAIHGANVTYKK